MAASLEEISADLEAGETREALIPRMPLFNGIAEPLDVGLNDGDFEVSATADNIEAQVPILVAADMSPSELASQLDERGLPVSGFQSADAKVLQKAFDAERAARVEELIGSFEATMEQERAALRVERDKTVMARLLAGEITCFEGDDKQHVRTLVRLMIGNGTKPRVAFSILDPASPPSVGGSGPLPGGPSRPSGAGSRPGTSAFNNGSRPGSREGSSATGGVGARDWLGGAGWPSGGVKPPSPLSSVTARVLAKALARNRSLVFLDLSENRIDDLGGCFLARALRHNGFLEHLEMRGNFLGPRTMKELAASLAPPREGDGGEGGEGGGGGGDGGGGNNQGNGPASALRGLNLEGNPLSAQGSDRSGVKAFAAMLAANSTLRNLSFFRTDLGDYGCRLLVEGLTRNRSVHSCDIGFTGDTTGDTVRAMADALLANHRGLAELKASNKAAAAARMKEAAAAKAAEEKEARRLAYLRWMEEEKADRVTERLNALDLERAQRLEAEAKAREEAEKQAALRAAEAAAGGKKGKKKKKK